MKEYTYSDLIDLEIKYKDNPEVLDLIKALKNRPNHDKCTLTEDLKSWDND